MSKITEGARILNRHISVPKMVEADTSWEFTIEMMSLLKKKQAKSHEFF